jgi:hypothetical protein
MEINLIGSWRDFTKMAFADGFSPISSFCLDHSSTCVRPYISSRISIALSILAPSLNATNRKRSLGISGSCDQEKVRAIVGAEDNPRARVTQRQRPTLESGSSIIPTQKEFKSTVWGRAFRGRRLSMVMAPVIGVPLGRSFFFQKYDKVGTFLLTPSRGRTFNGEYDRPSQRLFLLSPLASCACMAARWLLK